MLLLYAPAETDVKKVRDPHKRKRMKIEAIAWLSILFSVAALVQSRLPAMSFVIVATVVSACLFVHPWMYSLNGFDPVTREARK